MNKNVEALVEQRPVGLRSKSIDDLLMLPNHETEAVEIDGKDVKITTTHEISDAGRHRFVLQATRERWGRITAKVVAQGFEISNDQSFRTLTPEELYDFT